MLVLRKMFISEEVTVENQSNTNVEKKKTHSHSSHHHHHHHHRHHHKKEDNFVTGYGDKSSSKKHHHHHHHSDSSSKRERKGINIEYTRVKRQRIIAMIKRSVFCTVLIAFIAFLIYSIINGESVVNTRIFDNDRKQTESVEDLRQKIIDLEFEIDKLQDKLKQYENNEE